MFKAMHELQYLRTVRQRGMVTVPVAWDTAEYLEFALVI
jgi:hypothetical protein